MKHAIMVMGYGNGNITQRTIDVLDDKDIDFFIHWDKKFDIPHFNSKNSSIYFIKDRKNVHWGTDMQTIVERELLKSVYDTNNYGYVHLISSNDMPLMTPNYFKKYFYNKPYAIGFLDYLDKARYRRMSGFYPIRHLNLKSGIRFFLFIKNIEYLNRIFHVNRVKNKHIEKGCNWFSMKIDYVKKVLDFKDFGMFKHTFTGDEFYIQTILHDLKPKDLNKKYDYYSDDYRMTQSSFMAARYIDWIKGVGKPYVFKKDDVDYLSSIVNTKYAFGRKLDDYEIIEQVFKKYNKSQGGIK
ncbi:beta-1,6-N-acetylglucosaminyltransferase [Apilactobacillus nanyangensis]|uniref:beta-1,6-N-acetylglucosaminyltransferase n=1 Tax=Apilactobacillus nanyangensis TaxID=2799579 RepID=UPI00194334A0|nr:beta-1,6-N-acetylglucosaminyltransferase [Apilactobacillus nanyangensis]